MSYIQFSKVTFSYPSGLAPVFEDLSLVLDTDWKLGIIGRNGMGKSTLFGLLTRELQGEGSILADFGFLKFPLQIADRQSSGYELSEQYLREEELWKVFREANLLGLDEDVFFRPFATLSGGEQTKVQLAVLFASDRFPLLDEPTDHLDRAGREVLARYLSGKRGFFLISHDRAVLDACCDHILALEKTGAAVTQGNYTVWRTEREKRERADAAQKEKLEKERTRLKQSAQRIAEWSTAAEGEKFGVRNSGLRPDRGFLGAKAARVMKRATAARDRTERAEEGIAALLKGFEEILPLCMFPEQFFRDTLLIASDCCVSLGGKMILQPVSFVMRQGERIALAGANGTGKSTLLRRIVGEIQGDGTLELSPRLKISYVPQTFAYSGTLAEYAAAYGIGEAYFKAILSRFGFSKNDLGRDLKEMSEGQKKKAALARSLCERAHLYVWDEPLNYLDIASREQIEEAILASGASILFVEHDRAFSERIATRTISLGR